MSVDAHIRKGHPIAFAFIMVFASIELALSAWLTARYSARLDYPSVTVRDRVRFILFCSSWTLVLSTPMLLLFILLPTGTILTSVAAYIIFFFLTWIMWTAGAAAVTEMLGGGLNCSTQKVFAYCGQLNALEAFAWIIWILVTLSLIFVIVRGVFVARRGDGYGGALVD